MNAGNNPVIGTIVDKNIDKKSVHNTMSIKDAVLSMKNYNASCLLVRNKEGKGVGVISEYDVMSAFANYGDNIKDHEVEKYMSLDITCVYENEKLNDVIKLMAEKNIRYVPIVSETDRVISFASIMELLMAKLAIN